MTTSIHRVIVDGVEVGLVAHQDAAGVWYEGVEPTREEAVGSRRHCTAPPDVDGKAPHRLAWADVHELRSALGPYRLLFCPTCRTLITPPHDGYDYAADYPSAWLALVDEQPKSERT